MIRVHIVSPNPYRISSRAVRVEHCFEIGPEDESVAGCKGQVIGLGSGHVDIVDTSRSWIRNGLKVEGRVEVRPDYTLGSRVSCTPDRARERYDSDSLG